MKYKKPRSTVHFAKQKLFRYCSVKNFTQIHKIVQSKTITHFPFLVTLVSNLKKNQGLLCWICSEIRGRFLSLYDWLQGKGVLLLLFITSFRNILTTNMLITLWQENPSAWPQETYRTQRSLSGVEGGVAVADPEFPWREELTFKVACQPIIWPNFPPKTARKWKNLESQEGGAHIRSANGLRLLVQSRYLGLGIVEIIQFWTEPLRGLGGTPPPRDWQKNYYVINHAVINYFKICLKLPLSSEIFVVFEMGVIWSINYIKVFFRIHTKLI